MATLFRSILSFLPCVRTAAASVFIFAAASASLSAAPDVPGAKDNPQVKRVTGSQIVLYRYKAFDEMNLPLESIKTTYEDGYKVKDTKRQHVEGGHTILYYLMPADVGPFEVIHQYGSELKEQHEGENLWVPDAETPLQDGGGNDEFIRRTYPDLDSLDMGYFHGFNSAGRRHASFKGKSANGGDLYVSILAFPINDRSGTSKQVGELIKDAQGRTMARVDILETKPMTTRMSTVKAEEITDSLAKTGRIAIYGVYFDTDKSDLKPESKDALAEMAKAIKGAGAGKKFLIVGHTDNQGEFGYNLGLSTKRAKAVVEALARDYGLAPGSVISVGVGMAAPVAPNADEAGRAKNRRVEIVAM